MPRERTIPWRWVVALVAAGGLVALIATLVGGRRIPDGPEPVAYNRQACAHCRMLVGEPSYAAQLITTDGDVAFFDDPGCLVRYLDDHAPRVHRMWFHDHASERWWSGDEVGFVTAPAPTPMGFGLAAVSRTTATAIDLAAARARLATRRAAVDGAPHGGTP
jgi:copper chaperone NosL